MKDEEGFLHPAVSRALEFLLRILAPGYFSRDIRKKDYIVVAALILDTVALITVCLVRWSTIAMILVAFYATLRIANIGLQFAHALFVGYPRKVARRRSGPFIVGVNFVELIFLFGALYTGLPIILPQYACFCPRISDLFTGVYVSAVTSTTLGYGDYTPSGIIVKVLAASQSIFTVLVVAVLLSELSSKNDV